MASPEDESVSSESTEERESPSARGREDFGLDVISSRIEALLLSTQQLRNRLIDLEENEHEEGDESKRLLRRKLAHIYADIEVTKNEPITGLPCLPVQQYKLIKHLTDEMKWSNMMVKVLEERTETLLQTKTRLEKSIEEAKFYISSLEKKLKELERKGRSKQREKRKQRQSSEIENALEFLDQQLEERGKELKAFLKKYYPPPSQDMINAYCRKHHQYRVEEGRRVMSLASLLMKIMNKRHENPHDPWFTIDSTIWPPYVELLVRSGIIIRNPRNSNVVQIVDCSS